MTSLFPGGLDNIADNKSDSMRDADGSSPGGPVGDHAGHHNALADAVNALEGTVTATPTATKIPLANGSGKLATGWIPDLSATYQAVSGKGLASGYAGLDAGGKLFPVSQAQEVIALTDLTDATITAGAANHELIRDSTHWFNILHRYRPQAKGAALDGVTDDSTAINAMMSDLSSAGRGYVEFPNKPVSVQNMALYSSAVVDFNGASLKLPDSAAANADVIRGNNFDSLINTNGTGGIYRFKLMNGNVNGNRANNATGRHGIAVYGVGTYQNMLIHDCKGSGLHSEWNSGSTQLAYVGGAPGVADGDQTVRYIDLEIYDCEMRIPASGYDVTIPGGITGVTNTTNPTITTSQYHLLRAGQSITIASVGGATGVNGNKTVLAVLTATTFTITNTSPGVYTSGGTITYAPAAALMHKGADSPQFRGLEIWQSAAGVIPGGRGVLWGAGGINGDNLHVYQNFATGVDIASGSNSSLLRGVYVGGHDQGILVRQNFVTIDDWMINGSFNNSIGLDHQAPGGMCFYTNGRINGLTSGSYCMRIWNTSQFWITAMGIGDGGSNTSTLYTNPNVSTGYHGWLYNGANGVNASPGSLINFTT